VFVVYVRKQLKNLKRFKVMLHYLFLSLKRGKEPRLYCFYKIWENVSPRELQTYIDSSYK